MDSAPDQPFRVHACSLKGSSDAVRLSLSGIRSAMSRVASESTVHTMELVLAEILNNVVEHAYGARPGEISVDIHKTADGFHISVQDDGEAMPGNRLPGRDFPSVDVARSGLPEGGFGWPLIRGSTRDLSYRRNGTVNELTFSLPVSDW